MTGRVPDDGREIRATAHGEAARVDKNVHMNAPAGDSKLEHVVRRGWRGLGGWWWLAALAVPLLLAIPGALNGHKMDDGDLAVSTPSITAAPSATPTTDASVSAPAAGPSPSISDAARAFHFMLNTSADGKEITLEFPVPDQAAKDSILAATTKASPGVKVIDKMTITPGAPALPAEAVAALAGNVSKYPGVTVQGDESKITLTGEVATEALKTQAGTAAAALVPTATVDNQLIVKSSAPVSSDCAAVNTEVAAQLKAKPVQFAVNSATILPASLTDLNTIAGKLKGCLGADGGATGVAVAGHTDSDGADAYNLKLSQNRADAVKAALVKDGLPAGKITAKGYGETKPIADNNTDAGKAQNRRVEITLT